MRKLLLAATVMLIPMSASAQLVLNTNDKEPMTGLNSDDWAQLAKNTIDAASLIGKPEVYIVNATPYELTVMCDKWILVGEKPYISDNPHSLHPWKVAEINTKGFDGYCKGGVAGLASNGNVYRGRVNAPNGSFTDSTFITFEKANKQ